MRRGCPDRLTRADEASLVHARRITRFSLPNRKNRLSLEADLSAAAKATSALTKRDHH